MTTHAGEMTVAAGSRRGSRLTLLLVVGFAVPFVPGVAQDRPGVSGKKPSANAPPQFRLEIKALDAKTADDPLIEIRLVNTSQRALQWGRCFTWPAQGLEVYDSTLGRWEDIRYYLLATWPEGPRGKKDTAPRDRRLVEDQRAELCALLPPGGPCRMTLSLRQCFTYFQPVILNTDSGHKYQDYIRSHTPYVPPHLKIVEAKWVVLARWNSEPDGPEWLDAVESNTVTLNLTPFHQIFDGRRPPVRSRPTLLDLKVDTKTVRPSGGGPEASFGLTVLP